MYILWSFIVIRFSSPYQCCVLFSVLADAHFPCSSICKHGPKEVRADGRLSYIILGLVKINNTVNCPMGLRSYEEQISLKFSSVPRFYIFYTLKYINRFDCFQGIQYLHCLRPFYSFYHWTLTWMPQ